MHPYISHLKLLRIEERIHEITLPLVVKLLILDFLLDIYVNYALNVRMNLNNQYLNGVVIYNYNRYRLRNKIKDITCSAVWMPRCRVWSFINLFISDRFRETYYYNNYRFQDVYQVNYIILKQNKIVFMVNDRFINALVHRSTTFIAFEERPIYVSWSLRHREDRDVWYYDEFK